MILLKSDGREQKLEEAVAMARESLSFMRGAFLSRSDNFDAMLRDVVALLAYVQPEVKFSYLRAKLTLAVNFLSFVWCLVLRTEL